MNPTLIILTIVSTNWLPMSVEVPTGHGTTTKVEKEIGILSSNRYAKVIADNKTNTMLLSSEPVLPKAMLVRDKETWQLTTNWIITVPPYWTNRNITNYTIH